MGYLVWINNLVVVENNEEFDFLDEMYPEIKSKFNKIWKLKNASLRPIPENVRKKVNKINDEIERNFQILGIQNRILFIKKDDIFIEPVSGEEFKITNKSLKLTEASEEEVSRYTSELTNEHINFLRTKMPEFKESIKEYQKRK